MPFNFRLVTCDLLLRHDLIRPVYLAYVDYYLFIRCDSDLFAAEVGLDGKLAASPVD